MAATLNIVEADFTRADHRDAVLSLLNASATEPTGNSQSLSSEARNQLIPRLSGSPSFLTFLASAEDEPSGIVVCFCGQSHASGPPLLFISDFFVLPAQRRQGVGRGLLAAVEQKAQASGCCRLVLEVQETNLPARQLYESVGFAISESPMPIAGSVRLVKILF